MKKAGLMKVVCAGALAAACSFGLAGCGSTASASNSVADISDTSGGVAATVNGTEIGENAVTSYIAAFRESGSLTDDATWAQWLVDNDYTPDAIREQVINYYASQELIRQAAAENNITIDSSEIDSQVQTMRSYYSSDEDWQNALKSIGTDETQYRNLLEISLLQQRIMDEVVEVEPATDEELLQYAQMFAVSYNGAKKSSHILFNSDDEATAQEVLDKINSGELDFAEAAKEYSQDSGSKDDGGNVGWDKMSSFVTEYQTALDGLEEGQVSGLVTSSYGIHIIKCTEVFNAPDEVTSLDQIPSEFVDQIRSTIEDSNKQTAYSEWYQNYKDNADIQINEMPEGLAYDVSLDGIEKSSDSSSTGTATEGTTDSSSESSDAGAGASDASSDGTDASASDGEASSTDGEKTDAAAQTGQPAEVKTE